MTVISATLVKELRELTGAGIMDAKRALQETGGDVDAAKRILREKGMASAERRAGRPTTEGKVGYRVADGRGTIVGVGCETEPVSNNDEFLAFAKKVLEAVEADGIGLGRAGPEPVAEPAGGAGAWRCRPGAAVRHGRGFGDPARRGRRICRVPNRRRRPAEGSGRLRAN